MGEGAEGERKRHYFGGIEIAVLRDVYLPAEDSELLAENAFKHARGRALEIGTGSGLVAIAASKNPNVAEVFATDISPSAIECAKENARLNNAKITFRIGDMFGALREEDGKFDSVFFNPPYLPTRKAEKLSGHINRAFDGGEDGNLVAGGFVRGLGGWLAPGGFALMLASTVQDLPRLRGVAKEAGLAVSETAAESLFFEKLYIWHLEAEK